MDTEQEESQDMKEDSESDEQKNNRPWLFKKGQSGNPKGRPPGKTLKEYTREMLASMTDEERQEFLHGIPKDKIWEMSEGKAKSDDKIEVTLPNSLIEIIGGITKQTTDSGVSKEDTK